jgi:hypothetical protein
VPAGGHPIRIRSILSGMSSEKRFVYVLQSAVNPTCYYTGLTTDVSPCGPSLIQIAIDAESEHESIVLELMCFVVLVLLAIHA